MKAIVRLAVLMVLSVSVLLGQRPPNCDLGCGGDPPPSSNTGARPMETSSFITNARGTGSPTVATQRVGKSTTIEGSQSYTYAVNLFSLPGRNGLNLNLTLYYNSLLWGYNGDNNTMVYGGDFDSPSPGFRLDYGVLQFATDLSLGILTEPNGAKHLFLPTGVANQFTTNDSSYILVQYPATAGNPVIVTYKNGLRVFYQVFDTTYLYQYRPYQIEDTNGNIISIAYLNSNALSISTITDTVGRIIKFTYDPTGTMLQSVAQLNSSGQVFRQYTFTWDQNRLINFNFTLRATAGLGIPPGYLTNGQSTEYLLSKVTRPDGTSVVFDYAKDLNGTNPDNPDWGIVKSIQEQSSNGGARYTVSYSLPAASAGSLTRNPTYSTETVNDGVNTGTWMFQASRNLSGVVTCFEVADPQGKLRTTTFSSNGDGLDGLPTQETISNITPGSSLSGCPTTPIQVWRTAKKSWSLDAAGSNPRLASTIKILEDNSTQSEADYAGYDTNGNLTDIREYDFGSSARGPLLREAVVSYANLGNGILNRVSDIQVKDAQGGIAFHKKFNYDESALATEPSAPAGRDTNFSAAVRGNLTSTVVYSNAASGTGAITNTFVYDVFGNRVTSQLGCCVQGQTKFSATTQYAYPDSIVTGPTGSQQTVSYTYNIDLGTVASTTDINGQVTTFGYDAENRVINTTTQDGVVVTNTYDDAGQVPSETTSTTANSRVTKIALDGRGRVKNAQVSNGTSLVSTSSLVYDILGHLIEESAPYGPSESPVYTNFSYDLLGRRTSVTPPAVSSSAQNAYQSAYSLGQFADVSGNQRYGRIITFTDPAGKQRRRYTDILGRLLRVDEPAQTGGTAGSGSISILGTEQSVSVPNGGGATAGTGSVSFSGTERSTPVLTHNATQAVGTVTISGFDNSTTIDPCADQIGWNPCPRTIWDFGTVSLTVNGLTQSVSYEQFSAPSGIASSLASAFGNTGTYTVTASDNVITITANTAGASGNSITLSATSATGDYGDFGGPSFTAQASGGTLGGGSDDGYTTMYDSGTATVSVTIGGTVYSESSTYGQSSTPASIASDLTNRINSDTTLNQKLVASASSNVLNLTTTATGNGTADPLSTGTVTTSQYFAAGSFSFSATPSGSTLIPGQNGTVYDAGTVTVSITGFTATPLNYTANYSQGSTGNSVASALAGAINGNSLSPVAATVSAGSNAVSLTAKTLGADTNYGLIVTSATTQGTYFSQPSFSSSGTTMSGGADPSTSLTTPLSTYYVYDTMGHLTQVVQGQQTRTYTYDSLGRVLSDTIPETGYHATTITYTNFGAISQITDPRILPGISTHLTTTFGYDNRNRPTTITFNDGTPGVTYSYNPPNSANNTGGRLASVTNGLTGARQYSETYQYDVTGRPLQVVKNIGGTAYTLKYQYKADGALASITYPSGRVVSATEDGIGRLTQISTNGSNVLTIGSYNSAGQVLSSTYGNGMQATYAYNKQLQLSSLEYDSAGSAIMDLVYDFGGAQDNGQIHSITDIVNTTQSTSYSYDELGRLKTAQTNNLTAANTWKLKFTYDRYGNRLSEIPAAGTASMPMNEAVVDPTTNRITTGGFAYDDAGNTTSDGLYNYAYDAANQLTSVLPVGSSTAVATFAYDVSGLRVIKNNTVYVYSGNKVIAEYAVGASVTSPNAEHIYAGGQRIATISSGSTIYHYSDHLSTRIDADSAGHVVRSYGSYPFGETWYETSQDKWKFTDYERDSESGLDYAVARFSSPRAGRFMSLDPLPGFRRNPQSLNRYAYVRNDPINLVDPVGMSPDDDPGGPPCEETFAGCPVGGPGTLDDGGDSNGGGGDSSDLPDAPEPKWDTPGGPSSSGPIGDSAMTFVFSASSKADSSNNDESNLGETNQNSPASDAFAPGSLAYEVFGPPSRGIWASSSGFVNTLFAVEAGGAVIVSGVAAAPVAWTVGVNAWYGLGGAYTAYVAGGAGTAAVVMEEEGIEGGIPVFRVFGNEAQAFGRSWTTVNPGTVENYREAAGLFPGNSGQFVAEGVLNDVAGATARGSLVGPGGIGGGLPELVVPNPLSQITITRVSGANPPF